MLDHQEFRGLFEASADALAIVDGSGQVVAINGRLSDLLGWTAAELVGRPVDTLVPPSQRSLHRFWRDRYTQHPSARAMGSALDVSVLHRDGTELPVEIRLSPLPLHGELLILAALRDASERRHTEASLRRVSERAHQTLRSLGQPVVTTDAQGVVELVNPAAEKLTGWGAAEAVGRALEEVLPLAEHEGGAALGDLLERCLALGLGRSLRLDAALRRPDGQQLAVELFASLIGGEPAGVQGLAIILEDVTDRRRATRRLTHQATHDALTGLVNRAEFVERLDRILRAYSPRYEHAVVVLDLDEFKPVNDACGHAAGDELLRQLTQLLKDELRARDTFARLGGDEFAILLEHCRLEEAARIAENLRRLAEGYRFHWEGKSFTVHLSAGVIPIDTGDVEAAALLELADAACYQAKRLGRNRVHAIRPEWTRVAMKRGSGGAPGLDLARAVERSDFVLLAVPIRPLVAAAAGRPRFELLLRMVGEDGQLIPAGALLPQAERERLMPAIDRWVLREAVRVAARVARAAPRPLIAVNLSPAGLRDSALVAHLEAELRAAGVSADMLAVEVAESAILAHWPEAQRTLDALHRLGVALTVEDVGLSIMALAYLRQLPVSTIKVGMPWVRDVVTEPVTRCVVSAVRQVASILGLRMVASQVETREALDELTRLGVDLVQGTLFGPPVPVDTLLAGLPDRAAV